MIPIDRLYATMQRDVTASVKIGNLQRLATISGISPIRLEQIASGNDITMDEYLALNAVRNLQ
jgi:hypothetical protein